MRTAGGFASVLWPGLSVSPASSDLMSPWMEEDGTRGFDAHRGPTAVDGEAELGKRHPMLRVSE